MRGGVYPYLVVHPFENVGCDCDVVDGYACDQFAFRSNSLTKDVLRRYTCSRSH